GDDRKKIPAIYRSDRPEQIDANVSFVFLSDVVQTLGGMSVYSDQGRTSLVTMPKLYTFEEKLSLFFNYEDRYDFNDYTVGHKGYAFQQGPIEVLHIYYKEGYMRDLLADVPTNAAYRDPAMNGAGYITDITDVNFSEDGKIMTFHYYYGGGKTVTIDLPSAKVVSID
ncbi:MAG: hypothetical protein LBB94_08390, partial [Clostridiales bacterium]|nr:hypothetical protein [Clostridiales bacterium]